MSYIEKKVVSVFIVFVSILLITFVSLFYFNYQSYLLVYGEKTDEYIDIYLTDQEISRLNHELKYKDKIIEYKIVNISNEYIIHEGKYKRIIKIDFNYDFNDYIMELYLGIDEETNIWDYLYQKYMKGVI